MIQINIISSFPQLSITISFFPIGMFRLNGKLVDNAGATVTVIKINQWTAKAAIARAD